MAWNDGTQSDTYIGDTGNLTSRFRFRGEAKINPLVTAGFTYEWAAVTNNIGGGNQLNNGDDLGPTGAAQNAGLAYAGCGQIGSSGSTVGTHRLCARGQAGMISKCASTGCWLLMARMSCGHEDITQMQSRSARNTT